MKLNSKTFLYSVIITLLVGVTIFSYMLFLMPSMYMDYKAKNNLTYAKTAITTFQKQGNLKRMKDIDGNMLAMVLPDKGYEIEFFGKEFQGKLQISRDSTRAILDKFRTMKKSEDMGDYKKLQKEFGSLFKKASKDLKGIIAKQFKLQLQGYAKPEQYNAKVSEMHTMGKNRGVAEFSVTRKNTGTQYTTYLGYARGSHETYLTVVTMMTPTATDVRPVIVRSIPVIILMLLLLMFGVSGIFSKKIVQPIKKLSLDAENRMLEEPKEYQSTEVEGNDEIADLAKTLNSLYKRQGENFTALEEANKRKEVFMRASSHQLKTPIAASFLLIDGMMSKVGKYANRDVYLPKVKEQLQEMMKIVEDVLHLNSMAEKQDLEHVDMVKLSENVTAKHSINGELKEIGVTLKKSQEDCIWFSNREMLAKILENLVSNGIKHSQEKGRVEITVEKSRVTVFNGPAHIEEIIKDTIFEPFVTTKEEPEEKGHGLGLYVAKYFADVLNLNIYGENLADGVRFVLENPAKM